MVNVRFSNYEQFLNFFRSAPRNIQNILYKAYPEFATRMTNDYMNATKKISQTADKVKDTITQGISGSTPKQIGMVEDTIKATGKAAEKAAKSAGVLGKVGGKLGAVARGGARLATRVAAPIQGAINVFNPNSDTTDKLAGGGMIATGIGTLAGVPFAAPVAGGLLLGDLLKKDVAPAVGNKIAEKLYGAEEDYVPYQQGDLIDYTNLRLTPDEQAKINAYNKSIITRTKQDLDEGIAANKAEQKAWDDMINNNPEVNQFNNDYFGGSYPQFPASNFGITSQNSQNAQEGGLNNFQDNLYLEQYKPSLKPIVEPVNYSNEYLASQNNLINQLYQNANQGERQQMSMNNPYDLGGLRPYAQIDNQQAPVPNQQGLDYGAMLNQFNQAMAADQRQNQVNQMINAFGALGSPSRKAPIYYVGAQGDLRAIELDQPSQVQPLPTNVSSNTDKFLGQLKIQQAQQADMLARQKQAAADLKAQQEYIANQNMMNALGQHLNVDPNMFANPDIAKAALQYVFNPDIQSRANVQETIGKAPTQAMLKAAEQRGETAGKLDEIQLGKQFDAMIANINNNAKLEEQAMIQGGMDRRTAAQLANQSAINQYTQLMNNLRTNAELNNALQLQSMRGQNALNVAGIYANRQGGSQQLPVGQQIYLEAVKSGTPVPQAIKYAQVVDPTFGATQAELNELNR